jgi:hypothetical protein
MTRSSSVYAFGVAVFACLVGGATVLVGWAGHVLIDACAIAALGAGLVLAAWPFLDRRLLRYQRAGVETVSEEVAGLEVSLRGLALVLIAWGAVLPLVNSWWENRWSKTLAIVAGAIVVVVIVEYLWLRSLGPREEQVRQQQRRAARPQGLPERAEPAARDRRRWRRPLAALALLFFFSAGFGFSTWVGFHVRQHHRFNWELFGVVGTAIGTSLLALVTGFLALVTAGDVEASREIARTGREDQEARTRPIMLVEKVELTVMSHGDTDVVITLRNAGFGAAVRGLLQLRYVAGVTTLVEEMIYATSLVSGETKDFPARVTPSQAIPKDWRHPDWSLSGVFLDAVGRPHTLIDGQPEEPANRITVADPPAGLSI